MFENTVEDSIKKILEESEHTKDIAAAAFFKIYEAVDEIADEKENPYCENAAGLRRLFENVYAMVEVFEYGRAD